MFLKLYTEKIEYAKKKIRDKNLKLKKISTNYNIVSFFNKDFGIRNLNFETEYNNFEDILNKKIPIQESIDKGLKFLENNNGDYFLFDGSDSTSLMASFEVFQNSKAQYLFKSAKSTIE